MTAPAALLPRCESRIVKVNDIEVHYLRTGGGLPPLIGLHGLLGSGGCLLPVAKTLATDFDVILPDARGHGQSSAPVRGYLYPNLASDVEALIEALNLDPPVLLGHSMGGLTAAMVASRLGRAISRLILVEPTFISTDLQRDVFAGPILAEHQHLLTWTRSDLLNRARERSPHRTVEMQRLLVEARLQTSLDAFEVLTPPNPDWRSLVEAFQIPTLLVLGEQGVISDELATELCSLNPLLTALRVPGAGHGLPYDKPADLGEVVLSFATQSMHVP